MKEKDLRKLALVGLSAGLLVAQHAHAHTDAGKDGAATSSDNLYTKMEEAQGGNYGYKVLSESELKLELNNEGLKLFNSLSPEGKKLALEVASQRCNGQNKCKGLNACRTDKNSCAGKGACKGQSKCGFSDKNLAVKVVAQKMAEKRENAGKK